MNLNEILSNLPVLPSRQDAAADQLKELEIIAQRLGMLDAANVIRTLFETDRLSSIRMGCHCDIEAMDEGFEPDGCVIDKGDLKGCIYARPGMRKEECEYWRPYIKSGIFEGAFVDGD